MHTPLRILVPAVVQFPDGFSLPCPSNRAALQDLLEATSARLALGEYGYLVTLMKIRQHFRWLWIHTLEFARLSLILSRDSISEPELASSSRRKDAIIKDPILETSLMNGIGTVPKSMTPPVLRVLLNDQMAYVALDTGRAISAMNESTLKEYFPAMSLQPTMIQALKAFGHRIVPLGQMTVALIIYRPTHPVRIHVPFLSLALRRVRTPIFLGMNVMRAYGIDILCSTANPRVRIGTFGHGFALMNKPDLSPRLQALDPASPASFEGKSTSEPAEFAALVENSAKPRSDFRSERPAVAYHIVFPYGVCPWFPSTRKLSR
jgi:hypothetical protein